MDKVLVIVRGLPGSGKTTFAATMKKVSIGNAQLFAADDFEERYEGGFKASLNAASHAVCQANVIEAMRRGETPLFVHNVFHRREHIRPYADIAKSYGYMFFVVTSEGDYLSEHAVSYRVWERFRSNWEEWL